MTVVAWVAALGSALLGGIYVAFSVAVLPALARRPPAEAATTMQEINRVILNPVFLVLFAGTAVACLVVAGSPLVIGGAGAGWRVAGGLVGLAGIVTTAAVNVPLNTRLDAQGTALWAEFRSRWTPWNHVRAVTSVLAAVLLLLAAQPA